MLIIWKYKKIQKERLIKKLILMNKFFISSELNTDILEKTFEGRNVYRIWNNFHQYFQHIESKISNFSRYDKVILAFGLTQLIGREWWLRKLKIIRILITLIIFIGFATKDRKNVTPHHEMSLNSFALGDSKATYALTCDRRKHKS